MVKQIKPLEYEEDGYTRVEEKKERVEYKPVVEERSKTPGSKPWYYKTGNQECLCILIIGLIILIVIILSPQLLFLVLHG